MKTSRVGIHLLSVSLLLLWGGVMLYFYASGRLVDGEYLARDGWFRPMVMISGIGLCVLGLFNLATMHAKEADCCEHEHDHHHKVDRQPSADQIPINRQRAADPHSDGDCCGHDHTPEHRHKDGKSSDHEPGHEHSHGILEESGSIGRLVAIIILAVPVSYAAVRSPDRFSVQTAVNKGVYAQNYTDTTAARQYSRVKNDDNISSTSALPNHASAKAAETWHAPVAETNSAPVAAAQTKSYGTFTLADLKAQVPQNKEGNFLLEIPEIYYTAGDKEVQGVLAGQPVETTAQVLPEKMPDPENPDKQINHPTRLRIFRMLVQCCAADARPFSIPAEFEKKAPEFKGMTWVKVTGTMTYKSEGGQTVPVLLVTSMTESAEPDNKMMY